MERCGRDYQIVSCLCSAPVLEGGQFKSNSWVGNTLLCRSSKKLLPDIQTGHRISSFGKRYSCLASPTAYFQDQAVPGYVRYSNDVLDQFLWIARPSFLIVGSCLVKNGLNIEGGFHILCRYQCCLTYVPGDQLIITIQQPLPQRPILPPDGFPIHQQPLKVIIFTMIEEHRFRIFLDQNRFKHQGWTALANAGIVNIMLSSQDQDTPVTFEPGECQPGQRNHRIVQSPSQSPPAFPPGKNCHEGDSRRKDRDEPGHDEDNGL